MKSSTHSQQAVGIDERLERDDGVSSSGEGSVLRERGNF